MNYFAIGFGAVAVAALGVIDYANQASAAGQTPGKYSLSAYVASYGQRFGEAREARAEAAEAKARAERRRAGARPYLPEAPSGWTRRAWADGDNGAIESPKPELSEIDRLTFAASPLLKAEADKAVRKAEQQRNAESWVYASGDQLIAVRARYDTAPDGAGEKSAASGALSKAKDGGWGVVQGVAYGKVAADAARPGSPFMSRTGTPFHMLAATIGFHDAVRLNVYSNASDAATRAVLAAIDYDGMNSLLSAPLPYIGTDAVPVPPEFGQNLATLMLNIHDDLLTGRSVSAQDWLARASTPEDAMKLAIGELIDSWGADGIAAYDGTDATSTASGGSGGFGAFVKGLFGGGALKQAKAKPEPVAKPQRLKLSGGSSCIVGSAGRFCRD